MRRVSGWAAVAAATIGIAAFATSPAAAITFEIDTANTSVLITSQTVNGFGTVQAAIAPGLPTGTFNMNVGDTLPLDFIKWTASPFATAANPFTVTASLAFLQPAAAGTTTGSGSGFGVLFLGAIVGGSLTWTSGVPNAIPLGGGNVLTVDFEGGQSIILDHSVTTHAYLHLEGPAGGNPPAVPLPAALPLFASGLGALGLFGWRRRRKAAAAA